MRFAVLLALAGVLSFAQDSSRPACNRDRHGHLWPEEANASHEVARQFYQSGELEMCSLVVWRYKWEHLSINVQQKSLSTKHSRATAQAPTTLAPEANGH